MSNQLNSSRTEHSREKPPIARAGSGRVQDLLESGVLLAGVLLGLSLRIPPGAAQQSMGLGLKAGETYVLKGLDQTSTPQVRYDDNSQCFLLECAGPGKCSVIGAQAGHGSVTATLQDGATVVYDITVSALATPGKPLKPGVAPPPAGDIFARRPPSSESGPLTTSPGAPAPEAPAMIHEAEGLSSANAAGGPGSAPARPAAFGAGAAKYAQTVAANSLELPPGGPPAPTRHYLSDKSVRLSAGSSRIFDFTMPLRRVAIADTDVADVEVIGPNQLMVVAHKPGATTLSVWQEDGLYYERQVRIEAGGPQRVELHVVVAEVDRSKAGGAGPGHLGGAGQCGRIGRRIAGQRGNSIHRQH